MFNWLMIFMELISLYHSLVQVLEMIANYYGRTSTEKKRIINFCSQYPGIGLLNVAVSSMSSAHLSLNIANMYLYSLSTIQYQIFKMTFYLYFLRDIY